MNQFFTFVLSEVRQVFIKRNIIILSVLGILSLLIYQDGINSYKAALNRNKAFVEVESKKVDQYIHYTQYGAYGFRVRFVAPTTSVGFKNSGIFDELVSNIDVSERLNIYNSLKGESLFPDLGVLMDFGRTLFLFGVILGLIYGFNAFHNKEYIRYVSNFLNVGRFHFMLILSRSLLLNFFFLLVVVSAVLLSLLNGIEISFLAFLLYLIILFLEIVFFICCGAFSGMAKTKTAGIFSLVVICFIFVFIIPGVFNKLIRINAGSIDSNYELELNNLKEIAAFEKKFFKQIGIYRSGGEAPDDVKDLINSYIKNEYPRIVKSEDTHKSGIIEKISNYLTISSLFPTTFYFSAINEIGGKGYSNFVDFYSYNQQMKNKFFKFYIEWKYFSPKKKVENFIKNDENLFYARSRIPANLWLGLAVTLTYILITFFIANYRFKRYLYPSPARPNAFDKIDIDLKKGKTITINIFEPDFTEQFIDVFNGCSKALSGRVAIQGNRLSYGDKTDFVYLPGIHEIPSEIKTGALVSFVCGLLKLPGEKIRVLETELEESGIDKSLQVSRLEGTKKATLMLILAGLKNSKIYIFNDFIAKLPGSRSSIAGRMMELKHGDTILIDIIFGSFGNIPSDYKSMIVFDEKNEKYIELPVVKYSENH